MKSNIEICIKESESNTKQGNVLERLAAEILSIQQYDVVNTVRLTGMEIDVIAKHKINGTDVFVECKAWNSALPADTIMKLLGNVEMRGVNEGWLITTGPLSKDAEGIKVDWERRTDEKRKKLSFYTSDRIIKMLIDAKIIIEPDYIKNSISSDFTIGNECTLIVSEIGNYWIFPVAGISSNIITSVIVFDAKNGKRLNDKTLLIELKSLKNSFSECEWIAGKEINNELSQKLINEYSNIVPVISGDDWSDYRPARPEDFVGRKKILNDIFVLFDNIIKGQSKTRLFSITAPSGMGKSSMILKLLDMSKSRRKSKKYFVYAVDVRTAISSRYAELAVKACFEEADKNGFTDTEKRNIDAINIIQFMQNESIVDTLAYLKEENKVMVLIFDQFEELFSKKELFELFDNIRKISDYIDSQKQNFVIGFAWKTDLSIPVEHPAYYMWSNLADRRKEFEISQFSNGEVKNALGVFSRQLGEKINPILSNYLLKQCQGYPWLLKKLCIHVFDLIEKGNSQDSVIGKKLNIVDLFEKDLFSITKQEDGCIKQIARDTPADYFIISEIYGKQTVQELINRRIVIRRASKLTLYWDIFRDYVLNKTIPEIVSDYIPQYPYNVAARILSSLLNVDSSLTGFELSNLLNYKEGTIDNFTLDAVMFGVIKKENGLICLLMDNEEEVVVSLQNFFKSHIVYSYIIKNRIDKFDYIYYKEIFAKCYSRSSINSKTKEIYSSKLFDWFLKLGLFVNCENKYMLSNIEIRNSLETISTRRRSGIHVSKSELFWGQTSPEKVLHTYDIIKLGSNNYNELKANGLRNALEILMTMGGIFKIGNNVRINKSIEQIWDAIKLSETIVFVQSILEENNMCKGKDIGKKLNEYYKRNWTSSSEIRYGSALIRWSKYLAAL